MAAFRHEALREGPDPDLMSSMHCLEIDLHRLSGATARRVVDGGARQVKAHRHDWPVLSLFVMGDYRNETETGARRIRSPSAILYRAREVHANAVSSAGHEQIEIEFDPAWLGSSFDPDASVHWIGGDVALAARQLARLWSAAGCPEKKLVTATSQFLNRARASAPARQPTWIDEALDAATGRSPVSAAALASRIGIGSPWLTEAYRRAVGEGLRESASRRRVEDACAMLRNTNTSCAEIAAAVGFCDQSHMIRCFNSLLGRTPAAVRAEWQPGRKSA